MYKNKELLRLSYFKLIRHDLINLVPKGKNKIIEIGCASGATLNYLKSNGKASEIVGVDILDNLDYKLDKYIQGNIENIHLPYKNNYFDILLLGDVLEHLNDPWKTLKKLKMFVKTGGLIISSIPNIREFNTLFKIVIKGDFKYSEFGILDKTHLRFFCKKNIISLYEDCDIKVLSIIPNISRRKQIVNHITFKIFEEFIVLQYIILGTKI